MWPDQPFDFVKVPDDPTGKHFGLFIDDKIIAVVSLFIRDDVVQFRKLATETAFQGLGYGTALLSHVINWSRQEGYHKIWCNARANKTAFYQKFGMRETLHTYTKGGIGFIVMERTL